MVPLTLPWPRGEDKYNIRKLKLDRSITKQSQRVFCMLFGFKKLYHIIQLIPVSGTFQILPKRMLKKLPPKHYSLIIIHCGLFTHHYMIYISFYDILLNSSKPHGVLGSL